MSIYALGDRRPSFGEGSWIAHNATVVGSVQAGRNVSVWYNVVMRGDNDPITIGDDTNIQDGSVLHNDDGVPLVIGSRVTIGHMAMLHGCTIGDGSLIGINAVILNNAVIGKESIEQMPAMLAEQKIDVAEGLLIVELDGPAVEVVARRADHRAHIAQDAQAAHQVRPAEMILPSVKVTLLGGMQEPGHGAANMLVGLMQDPDQLHTLRADLDTETLLVNASQDLASIGDIATLVGMDDQNYFTRWFRKQTGQTPSRWRAAMR